jgi:hypothetical protein
MMTLEQLVEQQFGRLVMAVTRAQAEIEALREELAKLKQQEPAKVDGESR